MRVNVKLFAQLRDTTGAGDLTVDLKVDQKNDGATVNDVWRALVASHPALAPFESSVSCAVNATYARKHTHVNAGDEVAFLPPVSGG